MRQHSIGIGTFLLAAVGLLWLRGLALYAHDHPENIPEWLQPILEGSKPVQNSGLQFAEFVFDFGHVLEGRQLEKSFHFVNTAEQPITILKARKCSCVITEFPKDPIPAGGEGTIFATMDTRDRTGPQVKEIVMFTDEGEDSRVSVVLKASIESPLVLREKNLILTPIQPGATLQHSVDMSVASNASNVRLEVECDFLEAQLAPVQDGESSLALSIQAPADEGTVRGIVRLSCDLPDTSWTREFPVMLVVSSPFKVIPSRVSLRGGKGTIRIKELWPAESPLVSVQGHPDVLEIQETDRKNEFITFAVQLRDGVESLPEGTKLLLLTEGSQDPALTVAVVAKN